MHAGPLQFLSFTTQFYWRRIEHKQNHMNSRAARLILTIPSVTRLHRVNSSTPNEFFCQQRPKTFCIFLLILDNRFPNQYAEAESLGWLRVLSRILRNFACSLLFLRIPTSLFLDTLCKLVQLILMLRRREEKAGAIFPIDDTTLSS